MRELSSEFLTSETDQVGTGDHGDVGEGEDEAMVFGHGIYMAKKSVKIHVFSQNIDRSDVHRTAMAAGTKGHRKLHTKLALLVDLKEMRVKCQG